MTKTEIIQSVAYLGCPAGAKLVKQDIPSIGLNITHIQGNDAGALQILAAQNFESQLIDDAGSLPEAPDAKLFETLHRSSLKYNQSIVEGTFFEAVEEECISMHRNVVARLREIGLELGITYHAPEDPLLSNLGTS